MFVLMRHSAFSADPLYVGAVIEWQEFLLAQGHDLGENGVDGDFGPATDRATRDWQAKAGLKVDGKVGPKTIAAAEQAGFNGGLKAPEPEIIDGVGLAQVKGSHRVSDAFKRKVIAIGGALDIDPSHLMAVMAFETGFTFSPTVRNPLSKAVGLIQFTAPAATDLGTTTTALSRMSDLEQLDYVERYFRMRKRLGDLDTVEDVYMAVLWPALVGKSDDAVMAERGGNVYRQNRGLDRNDDGRITKAEAAFKVRQILEGARRVPIVTAAGEIGGDESLAFGTVLKKGDRGSEVQEVQALLVKLGHLTQAQMNTGVGIFGPRTEAAVEEFQHDHGLEYSGVVDEETLAALRARAEQLPAAEQVDPDAITTQMPASGDGFVTYGPRHKKFTTAALARALERLARRWIESRPGYVVQIGNISKRGGGPLPPHKSHRQGRDVDFRPFSQGGRIAPVTIHSSRYDAVTTSAFIDLLHSQFPGCRILFNDPELVRAGKCVEVRGHDNHLHVTFPAP